MEEKLAQKRTDCLKVVFYGPESTGKTTLAKNIATHYNCNWVPEYAREYLQRKWDEEKKICEPSDIFPIAEGQMELENKLTLDSDQLLILDTDLLETKVYSEMYYDGFCDDELSKYAIKNQYDLYFLTNIDIPWEADDLRDRPDDRQLMFDAFRNELIRHNRPFMILSGNYEERFNTATAAIDQLLKSKDWNSQKKISNK